MNVRSKLSLATGLGLLGLLLIFYLGGRIIVVRAFRQAERDVLHALPGLRRTLNLELEGLAGEARVLAMRPETAQLLQASAGGGTNNEVLASLSLGQMGLHLAVLATPEGQLVSAHLRPRSGDAVAVPHPSIGRHLEPGSRIMSVTDAAAAPITGLIMLDEGAMLVVAHPVAAVPGRPGVLLVGRYFEDNSVLSRVTSILPLVTPVTKQVEIHPPSARAAADVADSNREMLREAVEIAGLRQQALEARMPVYDIYGKPAFSLVVRLPHTFTRLAELALAWLTLLVAAMGSLFIIPIFAIQGRTVLNPLTRMVHQLRGFEDGHLHGQRLRWRRKDEFGEVAGAIDRMLDSIEHVNAQVEENERRMAALLTAHPDRILVLDREGRTLDAWPAGSGDGAGGVPGDALRRIREGVTAVLQTAQTQSVEFAHGEAAGLPCWSEARMARMDENRVLVMLRDVTEQHRARLERERLEDRMVKVQKYESLGALVGGIAQDFSGLFAQILGSTEQALRALPGGALGRAELEGSREAALKAAALTRQMLAYAGQASLRFEPIVLNGLVAEALQSARGSLGPTILVETAYAATLPLVEGDRSQLRQVIANLVSNAGEAIDGQTGTVRLATQHVSVSAHELVDYLSMVPLAAGDYVRVTVEDTGCGMDEHMLERLFDPFFTTRGPGRGLGMSSVLGTIRAHKGGIAVTSRVGTGTTVSLVLPASRDTNGELRFPSGDAKLIQIDDGGRGFAGETKAGAYRGLVLLAEDDPDIRRLIAIILKASGYDLLQVATGREAVDVFRQRASDICMVLLDVEMPEMNGQEALAKVRAIRPDVPVAVMSGYGEAMTRQRLEGMRVNAFLVKPFTYDDLLATMRELTNNVAATHGTNG